MAFQGEGDRERQNSAKPKAGTIAGLVSAEGWHPGRGSPGGWVVEERYSESLLPSSPFTVPWHPVVISAKLQVGLLVNQDN